MAELCPLGQTKQWREPVTSVYFRSDCSQVMQLGLPASGAYFPTSHSWQVTEADTAATAVRYRKQKKNRKFEEESETKDEPETEDEPETICLR